MKYPCLMYHEIGAGGKFCVSEQDFARQMDYIVAEGYESVDLRNEKETSAEKKVLITFDDGHVSNYRAAEMLRDRKLTGVFYVLKDESLLGEGYLSERQIADIAAMGHVIGVHGKTHDWWTRKRPDVLVSEIREVVEWVEGLTDKPVCDCSAPGGKVNGMIARKILSEVNGMRTVRNSVPWWNDSSVQDGILNAIAVCAGTSFSDYIKMLKLDGAYYLYHRAVYEIKKPVKAFLGR